MLLGVAQITDLEGERVQALMESRHVGLQGPLPHRLGQLDHDVVANQHERAVRSVNGIHPLVEEPSVQESDVQVACLRQIEGGQGDVGDLLDLQRVIVSPPKRAPARREARVAEQRRPSGSVRSGDELELRQRVARGG